jgi:hypothetical protein
MADPFASIDAVIAHRGRREAAVIEALAALSHSAATTLEALLDVVYAGLDPALRRFARATLEAHLIKLEHEGRAQRCGRDWNAT